MYGGRYPAQAPATSARPGAVYGHSSRTGVRRLGGGIGLAVALLVLGLLAKTGPVTSADTAIDRLVAHLRNPVFTPLAKLVTLVMTPEAWAVLAVVGAVVLFLLRRRGQALRVFCVMIGSTGVVFVTKALIDEHRPPKSLWVVRPDSAGSFPSGHTMAAAAVALCVLILVPATAQRAMRIAGAVFVAVVAGARVYLGVHYLLDVVGAVLAVAATAVFLSGLTLLPPTRRWLLVLDSR